MTAEIATGDATVITGQTATATLTVSNSSATDVNVLGIVPWAYRGSTTQPAPVQFGTPRLSVATAVVAAGGSTAYEIAIRFLTPRVGSDATVDVGATVHCADGSVIQPAIVAFTVTKDLPYA